MDTERLDADRPQDAARAAELLREGRLVAFPTETVYGLGARADSAEAVADLVRLKRRPAGKKFALLVAGPCEAAAHGSLDAAARKLADIFWPGPLTIVVPDGRGGDVGLRCPDCAPTRRMLALVGTAVAAPSANVSGEEPARTAAGVLAAFDGRIAAVLDGGPAPIGRPSTVVRVRAGRLEVLREGCIEERELRAALAGGQVQGHAQA